jgi:hypothetical protein
VVSRATEDSVAIKSRFVPYITSRVWGPARPFLPASADARLRAVDVAAFAREAERNPDVRIAVLGVLRAHAANGAEVVLSAVAFVVSIMSLAFAMLNASGVYVGWLRLIPVCEAAALFVFGLILVRLALAAHVRKMTAVAWLGAYEDALRESTAVRKSIRQLWLSWGGRSAR